MVIGFGVTAFILFLEGAVQADMQRLEENRKRKEEADREYREFRTKIGPR
jgi:multisubunit Na+/H+ antiporter MnhC subunit